MSVKIMAPTRTLSRAAAKARAEETSWMAARFSPAEPKRPEALRSTMRIRGISFSCS